jgi:Fe(3+) dicitrate transport protein
LSLGTNIGNWELNTRVKYKSKQRTTAGQGPIDATDSIGSFFVTDISASRAITRNMNLNLYINNLLDAEYEVSRHPDGLRPGAPRSLALGISTIF